MWAGLACPLRVYAYLGVLTQSVGCAGEIFVDHLLVHYKYQSLDGGSVTTAIAMMASLAN